VATKYRAVTPPNGAWIALIAEPSVTNPTDELRAMFVINCVEVTGVDEFAEPETHRIASVAPNTVSGKIGTGKVPEARGAMST
jgi:hypothetical protein